MRSLDSRLRVDCFQSFNIFVVLSVKFFAPKAANIDFRNHYFYRFLAICSLPVFYFTPISYFTFISIELNGTKFFSFKLP